MLYVAVDKDGTEFKTLFKPNRVDGNLVFPKGKVDYWKKSKILAQELLDAKIALMEIKSKIDHHDYKKK